MFRRTKRPPGPTPTSIIDDASETTTMVKRDAELANTRLDKVEMDLDRMQRQISPLIDMMLGIERPVRP